MSRRRDLQLMLKAATDLGKVRRFWHKSHPFRGRFGLVGGVRLAHAVADVAYRYPAGTLLPVHVPGWRDPLWMRAGTSDVEVFHQVVLGRELDFEMPRPRRIIDGGANIGIASRVFASRWPDAAIVAVELEASNFQTLRRNCATLPRIDTRLAALWSESGLVGVAQNERGESEYRVDASVRRNAGVSAVTIEGLLDELGWDTVDLVKLDIEGAEREVLATAFRWLPRVNHLVVELHERFAPGCNAAFESAIDPADFVVRSHGEYLIASRRGRV